MATAVMKIGIFCAFCLSVMVKTETLEYAVGLHVKVALRGQITKCIIFRDLEVVSHGLQYIVLFFPPIFENFEYRLKPVQFHQIPFYS